MGNDIIVFDGFCVLCSCFVKKMIKNHNKPISIIPFQSERGKFILEENNLLNEVPDGVILISNGNIYKGADAIVLIIKNLSGWWHFPATLAALLPKRFLMFMYAIVARNRHNWFGKRNNCYLG